jgi:hypothetical protein
MNHKDEKRLYLTARKNVVKKKIFFRDIINFIVFSVIFFVFNMIFTPGLWWSVIPIGIYALTIAATHSGLLQDLMEEKAILKEYHKLKASDQAHRDHQYSSQESELIKLREKQTIWREDDLV